MWPARLIAVGVPHLSVDVTLPTLVPAIAEAYGIAASAPRHCAPRSITRTLRRLPVWRARPANARRAGRGGRSGRTGRAVLDRLVLPSGRASSASRLGAVLDGLDAAIPDAGKLRSIRSRTAASNGPHRHRFTFFARGDPALGPLGELGRGGRYQAGDPVAPEPATGFTLYTDTILRTLPQPKPSHRLFVPFEADLGCARMLRTKGWITVAALEPASDWYEEARRLGCGHVLDGGNVRPVSQEGAEAVAKR